MCEMNGARRRAGAARAHVAAVLLFLALPGCAVYPHVRSDVVCSPALGEVRPGHSVVRLFYGTDRNTTRSTIPGEVFGNERSRGLKLGTCEVSIPASHGLGRLESPLLLQRPDPSRHVSIVRVSSEVADFDFLDELRAQVRQSASREIFVFVHGFAVTFDDAARRAAQIAHDVGFDGPAVLYSWPSRGWLVSYLVDRETAEWSARYLADLIELMVRDSGAERIHVLAHSMGVRLLALAHRDYLARMGALALRGDGAALDRGGRRTRLGELMLAAADVDAAIFARDYAWTLAESSDRVTIYTSAGDAALGGAQRLLLHPRLGQVARSPTFLPAMHEKIDVVDVSAVDRGLIGHFYYGDCPDVLIDMRRLLAGEAATARGRPRDHLVELLASER